MPTNLPDRKPPLEGVLDRDSVQARFITAKVCGVFSAITFLAFTFIGYPEMSDRDIEIFRIGALLIYGVSAGIRLFLAKRYLEERARDST